MSRERRDRQAQEAEDELTARVLVSVVVSALLMAVAGLASLLALAGLQADAGYATGVGMVVGACVGTVGLVVSLANAGRQLVQAYQLRQGPSWSDLTRGLPASTSAAAEAELDPERPTIGPGARS